MRSDKYSDGGDVIELENNLGDNYFIIIATHDPDNVKKDIIAHSIDHFLRKENIKVIIIASGEKNKLKKLTEILKTYRDYFSTNLLSYRFCLNKGISHKWNLGIRLALNLGAEMFTLLTDDTFPTNAFRATDITKYFIDNCGPTDLLSLPLNALQSANDHTRLFIYDSGMTFSKQLARNLRFDELLIHSFVDYKFSFDVATKLGKIIIYPGSVIDQAKPMNKYNGMFYLPEWTLYLIFRNSIYWARKEPIRKYKFLILGLFYFLSLPKWLPKSFRARRSMNMVLRAIFLGTLDGLMGIVGISDNLEKISNGRFMANTPNIYSDASISNKDGEISI